MSIFGGMLKRFVFFFSAIVVLTACSTKSIEDSVLRGYSVESIDFGNNCSLSNEMLSKISKQLKVCSQSMKLARGPYKGIKFGIHLSKQDEHLSIISYGGSKLFSIEGKFYTSDVELLTDEQFKDIREYCKKSLTISEQQTDTIKMYSYFSGDSSKVQRIKYLWNLDTVFVQDTVTNEIYPALEESGEVHYFDEGGSLIKNENLELTLPQNEVVVGRTSDTD